MTDDTISKLLRLKRYEQPPPEYFENFLRDFHRRQRAGLLRRPAWRVALERVEAVVGDFFGRFSFSQLAYGGASLAVLAIAGVLTVNMIQHPGTTTPMLALNDSANSIVVAPSAVVAAPVAVRSELTASVHLLDAPSYALHEFTLDPQIRFPDSSQVQTMRTGATSRHPRYILDARPVSYEPPFSF